MRGNPAPVLGTAIQSQIPLLAIAPKPEPPLPSLGGGYGFMETLTGTPWLSRAGPVAPTRTAALYLPQGLFLQGLSRVLGGVCPGVRHIWEQSCVSSWPPGVPKQSQPPVLGHRRQA